MVTELANLKSISKSFGGIHALRSVNFDVRPGEVHALLGENGAGKSTLMRVLGGEIIPSQGEVVINGKRTELRDPRDARALGIVVIHQELALAPDLSVAENIFLGELPTLISRFSLRRRAKQLIDRLGFDIDPGRLVGTLSVAHQQVVEIAKALSQDIKIIVFDEPTAVLGAQDAMKLHQIIRGLRDRGVGIVYISHRLDEVFDIADRMTVMKDGETVGTVATTDVKIDDIIRMMVGRPIANMFPERSQRTIGAELLNVKKLNAGRMVRDVSFSVRAGEIVGLGGLIGSGRTEVARAIFGADPLDSGTISLKGKALKLKSPRDAVKAGIGLVPEDRKEHGVVIDKPIRVNATMARMSSVVNALGFLKPALERTDVTALGKRLRLKASSIDAPVSSLSGGNQQKVVLAKWFHAGGDVIILDEPTRGVDVGAKAEIYALINKLAEDGKAVLVISSEHQELFGLCDRVLAMGQGQIRGELTPSNYSEENLLGLSMMGGARASNQGSQV
ncbi:sugar ABC transporter ATP-binding protein [Sinorhizobium meliloti]|uniref:sugar ABC transporter ATP-binding protein n=2 Tax=Rhizobium meliloti TaxID=382 RepID=UPI00036D3B06|nr:sugar ABC transporter ATP-binding protein [Sinorhizobium meliloti]ARS68282.1 lantibiotic ABC transporter permease [Sinorhizobium meliloti RU11/001]MDE3786755.1 sugar ABC transporter ATP-binding protein [Sinorhizobium meliloti]MDE3795183.1 sugar ABC transporter ATP-binding protein [Sinorhizobium meliloti]RVN04289.1 sugar ABC transporter ATP-binding protein [Sinorhizobium meliloti]